MKLFILALLVLAISAKWDAPRSIDDVNPAWTCGKLTKTNVRAKADKADGTKCQYVSYLIETLKQDYGTPQYPACYAQLDGVCDTHIVDYYEKRNIKRFVQKITVLCQSDDPTWEHFQTVLNAEKEKHADIFASDYWSCVSDNVDQYVQDEYVTGPSFPAPFLDVLNYVCQQVQADMRNIDRVNFNTWFENNGKWATVEKLGRDLFLQVKEQIEGDDTLDADLRSCFSFELAQFAVSTHPEVYGAYNTQAQEDVEYDQAYMTLYETVELPYPVESEEYDDYAYTDIECWNFYAPKAHYKQPKADNDKASVTTNSFAGNRGHPLCPHNTMYQPITRFGPLCCPIHPTRRKPFTYNCCTESTDMSYTRTFMRRRSACYGCSCLEGYEMDTRADFFGLGERTGACVQKQPATEA